MILFLRNLDDINQKLDNMYPVDESSSLMKEYFVMASIMFIFIAPLFMAISFVAHVREVYRESVAPKGGSQEPINNYPYQYDHAQGV